MIPKKQTSLLKAAVSAGLLSLGICTADTPFSEIPQTDPGWESSSGLFGEDSISPSLAQNQEAKGNYKKAAAAYKKLADRAEGKKAAGLCYVKRGDMLVKTASYNNAYEAYRTAVNAYSAYIPYNHVLDQLRIVGRGFADGVDQLFGAGNSKKAIEVYELIQKIAPSGKHAAADGLKLASFHRRIGETTEAVVVYRRVIRNFPGTLEANMAHFELGELLLEESRRGDGDGRYTREARAELEAYLKNAGGEKGKERARKMLAELKEVQAKRLLVLGQFYLKPVHRRAKAARRYLSDAVREFPGTKSAAKAEALLAEIESIPDEPVETVEQKMAETANASDSAFVETADPDKDVKWLREEKGMDKPIATKKFDPADLPPTPKNTLHPAEAESGKWLLPLEDYNAGVSK